MKNIILIFLAVLLIAFNLEVDMYRRDNKKIKELFSLQLELDSFFLEEISEIKEVPRGM